MEQSDAKRKEYAKLLIEVGLNLRKGQTLVLSAPVECADFARLCASAAYDAGCREVVEDWEDPLLFREKCLRASDEVFDEYPAWRASFLTGYAEADAAFLGVGGYDPELLCGVDPDRMTRYERASEKPLETYNRLLMSNFAPWCIASIPVPSWAKKVFPDVTEDEAMNKLWEAIYASVRITGDGKAVERWRAHLELLEKRKNRLNELRFRSLRFRNGLGTDLTVELPDGHLWAAGSSVTPKGQVFVSNMPTEEIFTAPLRGGVNGVVHAALPLVLNGNIVDGFHFVVKDGKVVSYHARRGEEHLKGTLELDAGSSFFGEVALVPYDSAISRMGILFYDTLFDENARCHMALGEAYPECIDGGQGMTREELDAKGLNYSIAHEDFMIGTSDLSVVGTTADGEQIPVFVDGNFAF
ncbi:MAG: aminopeptidase [Clostridia bacterium]|nr:aminopeptidase [Clostridia bacterium]